MPYPRKLLNPGEEIAFDLHPHWWYFSGLALAAVVILAGAVATPILLNGQTETVVALVVAGLGLLWVIWFLAKFFAWRTTHFVLTTDRLIVRSGVFGRQGREIPLERVNDLSFHQSLFERMVGTGDLVIESAGRQGQDVFSHLPHPDRAQQQIYTQMENNRQRVEGGGRPEVALQDRTIPEQISELARLRDAGVLTEAEFQAKKADLLQRM
ncbi:MAG TPA: PH domain-containing protein [Actinomycetota bacterium]|nr:PH domain-containing protein [Actinomycetota bacterium]